VVSECPRGDAEKINLAAYSAYLSRIERAEEWTRTADLLIRSVRSVVAERYTALQIPLRQRGFCSLPCLGLQGIASGLGSTVATCDDVNLPHSSSYSHPLKELHKSRSDPL